MDNQAFHSSRDSELSAECSMESRRNSVVVSSIEQHVCDMLETQTLSQVDPQLKEIIEVQMKRSPVMAREPRHQIRSTASSEVPLVDELHQGSNQISVICGEGLILRKRSNGDVFSRTMDRMSFEGQTDMQCDTSGDHHYDTYRRSNSQGSGNNTSSVTKCQSTKMVSRTVQAWPTPSYRLRVLPRRMYHKRSWCNILGYAGRCAICQVGLSSLLVLWVLVGAFAFHYTEGPFEDAATKDMATEQEFLVNSLIEELMESSPDEAKWRSTIERYMFRHEMALTASGGNMNHEGQRDVKDSNDGGGPRDRGRVWSLPGCTLFAVSLITTLDNPALNEIPENDDNRKVEALFYAGFGAPVPRTSEGRAVAVFFAGVGIPLHLMLVLNIGMVIAVKLQTFANRKNKSNEETPEDSYEDAPKSEKSFAEITRVNGIIPNKHRRSGSEPIGRQAISNITREANFIISDKKETKYIHISETEDKLDDREPRDLMDDFIPNKKLDSSYEICNFKNYDNLTKEERKLYKDIGSQPNSIPSWLKWLPFVCIAVYYVLGVIWFGIARYQPFLDSLMFPLNFTVAGGVAYTSGYVRVLYAIYLEGAVILTASTVAILKMSATEGFTDMGLRYGLLTNSR